MTACALLAATAAAQAQDAEESASPDAALNQDVTDAEATRAAAAETAALEAQLELAGATIREVNVTVDNVFNPDNPKENKPLYRWANKVHVPTHDPVIESALLFKVGDRYDSRVLAESARALRGRGYLADVKIGPENYDAAANTVGVDVHVRDAWTLAPELKFSQMSAFGKIKHIGAARASGPSASTTATCSARASRCRSSKRASSTATRRCSPMATRTCSAAAFASTPCTRTRATVIGT